MKTKTTKHTPGPWNVIQSPDASLWIQGTPNANGFREVARLPKHFAADDERVYANARLIAAAPDLLEACELLNATASACFEDILQGGYIQQANAKIYREAKELARIAINKASML